MKIIIVCEESQTVCKAFRANGHEAFSCDILPTSSNHPEWHIMSDGDMHTKEIIYDGNYDMMIAHPDCTYLTVTANKWLKDQPARKSGALVGAARREAQRQAIVFAEMLWLAPVKRICIENPVGVLSTKSKLGTPAQIIQPFHFGHPEPKKTCFWLKGLPRLNATKIVEPEYHTTASGKRLPKWYAYADKSKGQAERARIRSRTFEGIANAMSIQWNF